MDHGEIVAEGTPRELKRQVAGDSVVLELHDDEQRWPRRSACWRRPNVKEGPARRPAAPLRRGRRHRPPGAPPPPRPRADRAPVDEHVRADARRRLPRPTGRSLRDAGAAGEKAGGMKSSATSASSGAASSCRCCAIRSGSSSASRRRSSTWSCSRPCLRTSRGRRRSTGGVLDGFLPGILSLLAFSSGAGPVSTLSSSCSPG